MQILSLAHHLPSCATCNTRLATASREALRALALAARTDLAARLQVDASSLSVDGYETVTFTDSSLGFAERDGAYAQCMIDGFIIRYSRGEKRFEFHGMSSNLEDGAFAETTDGGDSDFWKLDGRGILVPDVTEADA